MPEMRQLVEVEEVVAMLRDVTTLTELREGLQEMAAQALRLSAAAGSSGSKRQRSKGTGSGQVQQQQAGHASPQGETP